MSYRAFKRLLGETSLERKCRFLFGAGILLLITISFWIYAQQNADLAYEQATATSRLLVNAGLGKYHLARMQEKGKPLEGQKLAEAWQLDDDNNRELGELGQ